ncbi:DNA translocase FtsK [Salibacterium salarium]|uniref:DNA translocase FtsK n=1 Tax=Salibacterium salarium TaxID=284579 RepID=A0A3R9QLC2_9BACI|nr:DNA translocase FtsK [Salibacterium salarium]RSL32913.1 DNA translocase FtsK [Salibacterium salarium]
MAGSFQRIKQKMQDFFSGEEIKEESRQNVSDSRPKAKKQRKQHTQIQKDAESSAKVVHHYPKKGNFRFPLDVEESKPQQPVKKSQTTENFSAKTDEKSKFEFSSVENTRAGKKDERPTATEKNEEMPPADSTGKQNYFQGNDFSSADIPSPVFGFERVPLHPDFLKKRNHTVLPVTERQENKMDEEEASLVREEQPAWKEGVASSVVEEEVEESTPLEPEDDKDKEASISHVKPPTYEQFEEKDTTIVQSEEQTPDRGSEKQTESMQTENEPAPVEAESEHLSRQERRRQRRESREQPSQQESKQKASQHSVPFNVLMYADGQKSPSRKEKTNAHPNKYEFPGIHLLNVPPKAEENGAEELQQQKQQLEDTLHNFNVNANVVDVTKGPSVTRYEVQPAAGVKVNKITNLTDDMKLALAAKDLRMEAPIPGKNAIGIEVPNPVSKPVFLREILRRDVFTRSESPLTVAMGLDISGNPIVADLQKMPHGLIAGATGSGKSVCINSILLSLLYKSNPEEVKLMLIDPKMVELASYKEIPHLVTPVINDAKEATAGLKWAVTEMEDRYERLAHEGVRDITKYNERMQQHGKPEQKMPYIVIIIDELADLMMVSPQDVEDAVCRIAQKARACGIHLLLATQRPSVDVITGLIKANIPSRTAFAVSSQVDSRTILDMGGAERLIGKGDMLFHENSSPKPLRVQGTFVSDEEIDAVTDFVKQQKGPSYMFQREELAKKVDQQESGDDLFLEACQFVSEQGSASSSLLQRHFSIGYNRAAKLIDMMEKKGIISGPKGSKPRQVLMSQNELEEQQLI